MIKAPHIQFCDNSVVMSLQKTPSAAPSRALYGLHPVFSLFIGFG
jgi:hypothetical protein